MQEVDVQPVDLGDELRVGVQPPFEPPVVVAGPVPGQFAHGRELGALRLVGDGLHLRPAGREDPAAEIGQVALLEAGTERADGAGRVRFGGEEPGGEGADELANVM